MKTAVLLSAASLAAAFVIPGNDQQLLSALSKDVASIAPAAEEVVQPPSQESPKERIGHHHHDDNEEETELVGSAGDDSLHQKWHRVAGFAEGLEKTVKHFEDIDMEWLGRSDEEYAFGREEMKKEKHGKGKKHHKDDEEHFEGKHHKGDGKKHGDGEDFEGKKHHKDEKHHAKGKYHEDEKEEKAHHKGEHAPDQEVDEFDLPECPHHAGFRGHHGDHRPGFFSKAMGKLKHMLGFPATTFEDGPDGPEPPHGHTPHGPPHGHPPHGPHHDRPNSTIYEKISKSNHTRIFTRIINQYDEVVQYLNSTSTNYTVFVPIDAAFEGIHHPHHNFSKEAILHWLEYHISPEVFTIHDFFDVQTVPTLRHEVTKSKFPQRISTSFSRKGLTLNYHSHVIRPDIVRPPLTP